MSYPAIKQGKLVLVNDDGSMEFIGISGAQQELAQMDKHYANNTLRPAARARMALLRGAVAHWNLNKGKSDV